MIPLSNRAEMTEVPPLATFDPATVDEVFTVLNQNTVRTAKLLVITDRQDYGYFRDMTTGATFWSRADFAVLWDQKLWRQPR